MDTKIFCKFCNGKTKFQRRLGNGAQFLYVCDDCESIMMPENIIDYNEPYYDHLKMGDPGATHNMNLMSTKVPKGKFLDIGCGAGFVCHEMHKAGYDVTGFDIYDGRAKDVVFDSFVLGDSVEECIRDKYDLIQLREVYEHVEDPVGMLKFCYEHLNNGGYVFVQTPNAKGNHIAKFARGHIAVTSQQALKIVTKKIGFVEPTFISSIDGCLMMCFRKKV